MVPVSVCNCRVSTSCSTQDFKEHVEKAGIVIINRGLHFEEMPYYERDLAATSRYLRYTYPNKLIIFGAAQLAILTAPILGAFEGGTSTLGALYTT